MSGAANFPGSLDDDASLYDVTDSVTTLAAAHHNNLKEAIKALEAKVGIRNTVVATALDYRLSDASYGHRHDGASGAGPRLHASTILHNERWMSLGYGGSIATSVGQIPGLIVPADVEVLSVQVGLLLGGSGGTTVIDIHAGATSLWEASQGARPMLGPTTGTILPLSVGTVNLGSVPSGTMLRVDVDGAGSNSGGQGLSVTFRFRE